MFCNNSGDLLLLFLFPSHAGGGFCRIPSSTAPSSVHPAQPGGFSGFSWWQVKRSCVLQLGGGFLEVFGSFLSCRVFRFPPPHSPCHRPLSKGTWFFSLFFSPEPCILEAALPPAPAPSAPFPWSVPFFPLVSLWSAWDGLCLPGGEWFNSEPCLWLPSPVSRGLLPLLDPRSPGGSGDGHFSFAYSDVELRVSSEVTVSVRFYFSLPLAPCGFSRLLEGQGAWRPPCLQLPRGLRFTWACTAVYTFLPPSREARLSDGNALNAEGP